MPMPEFMEYTRSINIYIICIYINAEVDVMDAIGRLGFCEKQRFGFLVPTSLDELGL